MENKGINIQKMKTKIRYVVSRYCLGAIILFSCSNSRNTSNNQHTDTVNVKAMVDAQSFVFIPRYVNPMSGRRRDLGSGYELSVSKDSVISYLPFFGRGYTAPVSPADIDFDFTSTKFTYVVTPSKKGWNISIKPKDKQNVQELYLRVFDNGATDLNITSIDRSSISYDGYLIQRKPSAGNKK